MDIVVHVQLLGKLDFQGIRLAAKSLRLRLEVEKVFYTFLIFDWKFFSKVFISLLRAHGLKSLHCVHFYTGLLNLDHV